MHNLYFKKSFFLLLAVLPFLTVAQPYLLLDREFKQPAELADQLEPKKFTAQYFPVFGKDVAKLITITEQLIAQLDRFDPVQMESELAAGNSRIVVHNQTENAQSSLSVKLQTRDGNNGYSIALLDKEDGRQKRLKKLNAFLNYLRNNRRMLNDSL